MSGQRHDAQRWLEQALEVHRRLGAASWETETAAELAQLTAPVEAGPEPSEAELRRDGGLWLVRHGDTTTHLRDLKGLDDLATLLARPGRDVHVLELAGALHREDDSGPVLDATARASYRRRVVELDRALANRPDPARTAQLVRERDALAAELSRAGGLSGRTRPLGTATAERARKAICARLRDAITRVTSALPELGHHLDQSVITGTTCRYDPDEPLTWRL